MLAVVCPPGILAQAQNWQTLLKKKRIKTKLQNIQEFNCKIILLLTNVLFYFCVIISNEEHL